jgi:hypothetical protein
MKLILKLPAKITLLSFSSLLLIGLFLLIIFPIIVIPYQLLLLSMKPFVLLIILNLLLLLLILTLLILLAFISSIVLLILNFLIKKLLDCKTLTRNQLSLDLLNNSLNVSTEPINFIPKLLPDLLPLLALLL